MKRMNCAAALVLVLFIHTNGQSPLDYMQVPNLRQKAELSISLHHYRGASGFLGTGCHGIAGGYLWWLGLVSVSISWSLQTSKAFYLFSSVFDFVGMNHSYKAGHISFWM